ncbi:MAG: hypothetical protein NTV86_16005 [Planctomycetota bacterium]|nr:hypothetical protein [Planctomycetota bacterium]
MAKPADINVVELPLAHCGVAEHCQALQRIKALPFWWYIGTSGRFGNFSIPFQDRAGHWWYQVKPGLCWPADCFAPIPPAEVSLPWGKSFLGYQHVVPDEAQADSHLVINAVLDLASYGSESIDAKRRNSMRKGFKCCSLEVARSLDEDTLSGCLASWNDLSGRSGWKHCLDPASFGETFRLLLDCPGVSVIVGREIETGQVAGFLVTKIIGPTAYVDTIASRTDMLHTNVNDAVMAAFVMNAAKIPGVTSAHYAIKSNVTNLEKFKTGLGFVPHPFPARTRLRPGVGLLLKTLARDKYDRMTGRI